MSNVHQSSLRVGIQRKKGNVCIYHLNRLVSRSPIAKFMAPFGEHVLGDPEFSAIGPRGRELVRKILDIPGVDIVAIEPYQVTIIKGTMFDWEQIQDALLALLLTEFHTHTPDVVEVEDEEEKERKDMLNRLDKVIEMLEAKAKQKETEEATD